MHAAEGFRRGPDVAQRSCLAPRAKRARASGTMPARQEDHGRHQDQRRTPPFPSLRRRAAAAAARSAPRRRRPSRRPTPCRRAPPSSRARSSGRTAPAGRDEADVVGAIEPPMLATTADRTKTRTLKRAVSTPATRAATSEPWIACSARPTGESIRFERQPCRQKSSTAGERIPGGSPATRSSRSVERRHGHAVGAAGPALLVVDDDRDDDAEAERRHREVVALQPQDGPRDHERQQRRWRRRRRPAPAAAASEVRGQDGRP